MAQVTRMECDVCGKSAAMDNVGEWWTVSTSQRTASAAVIPFSEVPGMPPGRPGLTSPVETPTEPVFGASRQADVCSSKCAQQFAKDSTTAPKKATKEAVEAEVVEEPVVE